MVKQSAGLLVYRTKANNTVEVLLVHPGGPYWAKKDEHAWSIPKGEFDDGEEPLTAAKREFQEEVGKSAPEGEKQELGFVKTSGKIIYAWMVAGDLDVRDIQSNSFEMEWPPHSGEKQTFPEVDKAAWFSLVTAKAKIHKGQVVFIERLADLLHVNVLEIPAEPPVIQQSLF